MGDSVAFRLPDAQEGPVEPRYEGDVYVALPEGEVVPLDRLLREAHNLLQIAHTEHPRRVYLTVTNKHEAEALLGAMRVRPEELMHEDQRVIVPIPPGELVIEW